MANLIQMRFATGPRWLIRTCCCERMRRLIWLAIASKTRRNNLITPAHRQEGNFSREVLQYVFEMYGLDITIYSPLWTHVIQRGGLAMLWSFILLSNYTQRHQNVTWQPPLVQCWADDDIHCHDIESASGPSLEQLRQMQPITNKGTDGCVIGD